MSLFSVNTNLGALAALQALDTNQQQLTQAQNEVSTGQAVGSASDNPAIYSISNTINANIAGLSAVSSSLNFGAQIVSTASSAISSINTVLSNLQQTVTTSGTTGINQTTLQAAVTADLTAINQYAAQSTFNGVNLLTTSTDPNVDASSFSLNVVQGLDGSVYNVVNQASALNSTASTLTDALGLTGLNVLGTAGAAAVGGVQVSFNNSLSVGVFAPASTVGGQTAAPSTDAAFQVTTGTGASAHTYSFEFTDDGAATSIPLQTKQDSNTTIVAVHIDSTKDSTNQITGQLINALKSNGLGVVQNTDGSLNIVGSNVQSAQFGTVNAGTFTSTGGTSASPSTTSGVDIDTLTSTQALVTTVQNAVNNSNTIAANLGAASIQISGIQTFTSALSSALTAGVGALTDADLAAESAKLTSLQTKQQLATQSLSIANKQPQSLLTLFQGL
jgi:flagellin